MSLTRGLATVALEVLGVLVAIGLLAALTLQRRPTRGELRFTTVAAVGALSAALALAQLATAGSSFKQASQGAVSARAGLERCFYETGAGARLPFVRWLRARIGPHAVYAIDYTPQPDPWCLFLVLLPALPAVPGERHGWTIAFGAIPAEMRARIARHDPSVQMFAPGFALESEPAR